MGMNIKRRGYPPERRANQMQSNYNEIVLKNQARLELQSNEKLVHEVDYNGNKIIKKEKVIKRKGGYGMYYPGDFFEAINKIKHSEATISIFIYLAERLKKDGTVRPFKMKEITEQTGYKRTAVWNAFKLLDKLNIVKKIDNEYRVNPFIININGQSEDDCANAQAEWKYLTENKQKVGE